MKAIVYRSYGLADALRYEEVAKPVPGDDEVLIRVRATSINPLDLHLMRGRPYVMRLAFGLRKPKMTRPGRDVAGEVEAVGANVSRFKPGEAVFGACSGALAEYACASESSLAAKPANMSFEQAACVPVAGLTALQGLRDMGKIEPGRKVLINGASGGVGTFAVQIARSFGAEVTGVCGTANMDLVRSIGADRVIDYTKEDFTRGGERYDLIFDAVGNVGFAAARRVLTGNGILVGVGVEKGPNGPRIGRLAGHFIAGFLLSRFVSQKMVLFTARLNKDGLASLAELMAAGKVTPVIDRRYTLGEAAEAIRYLAQGHARGKVVVAVEP